MGTDELSMVSAAEELTGPTERRIRRVAGRDWRAAWSERGNGRREGFGVGLLAAERVPVSRRRQTPAQADEPLPLSVTSGCAGYAGETGVRRRSRIVQSPFQSPNRMGRGPVARRGPN